MGSLAVVAASGVALLVCAGLVLLAWRLRARVQAATAQAAQVQSELSRSQAELAALGEQVARLSERSAAIETPATLPADHRALSGTSEFNITSLSGATSLLPARPRPVSRLVEDRVVGAVTRRGDGSAVTGYAAEVVVRTLALGHGVRLGQGAPGDRDVEPRCPARPADRLVCRGPRPA